MDKDLMKNPFMTNEKFSQQFDFLKEEGEFDRILKVLTVPAKSGIYLSRFDIRKIGLSLGVDITVRERKEMLKDLFYYSKQLNKMKEFLDLLIQYVNSKIEEYRELQEAFPKTRDIIQTWIDKAEKLNKFIENLKKEVDIYKAV
jgi:ribosomal protein L5